VVLSKYPLSLIAELILRNVVLSNFFILSLPFVWFFIMLSFPFHLGLHDLLFAFVVQALFMPYDHRNTTPDGVLSERMRSLLSKLNNVHCHKHCMIGSGGGSVGFVLLKLQTCFYSEIS